MSIIKAAREFQAHLDRTAAKSPDQMHDATWAWTTKAMADLKKLAKEAKEASKAMGPADVKGAAAMRAVEKRALDGLIAVAKVFGDSAG